MEQRQVGRPLKEDPDQRPDVLHAAVGHLLPDEMLRQLLLQLPQQLVQAVVVQVKGLSVDLGPLGQLLDGDLVIVLFTDQLLKCPVNGLPGLAHPQILRPLPLHGSSLPGPYTASSVAYATEHLLLSLKFSLSYYKYLKKSTHRK